MNAAVFASRRLAETDLNRPCARLGLYTYWCREAFAAGEQWNYKTHSHSFFELHLCRGGSCVLQLPHGAVTLEKGQLLLLPPHMPHTLLRLSPDFRKLVWGFKAPPETGAALAAALSAPQPTASPSEMANAADLLLSLAAAPCDGAYAVMVGQLELLYVLSLRCFVPQRKESAACDAADRLPAVRQFMLDNLACGFTVREIAAQFYMSERQFYRLCVKGAGMTPHALRESLQMKKIRALLSETDMSLAAIAAEIGFADAFSLGRFFKRHEGLPPAAYRRALNVRTG